MKIFLYSILIIGSATVALYFIKPTTFHSLKNNISNKVSSVLPIENKIVTSTIYKWKNKKGVLQVSDKPPPNGVKYTSEEIQHGFNIMPADALTGKTTNK